MRRGYGIGVVILATVLAVGIGLGAYHAGFIHGLESNGNVSVIDTPREGFVFFPFGFFHVSQGGTAAQLWNDLNLTADAGFNIIHSRYEPGVTDATYGAFLDQAAQRGVRVISEPAELLTTQITNFKSKTAILAWNIADDVDDGTKTHALIRPHDEEWRHLKVEWLTDVAAARKKAAAEDRPIIICYTGGAGYNEPLGTC